MTESDLYMPWFCQSTHQPEELNDKIAKIKCCSSNIFALSTVLRGYITQPIFYHLCIFVYRFLQNPERNPVYQWKGNIWREAGDLKIYLSCRDSQEVWFNTACSPGNKEAISDMWRIIKDIYKETDSLTKTLWPGFINETLIICPHCVMKKEAEPEDRLAKTIKDCPVGETCECPKERGVKLPAALFYPLPNGRLFIFITFSSLFSTKEINSLN